MKSTIIVKNIALAVLGTVTIGIMLSIGRTYNNSLTDIPFMNVIVFSSWNIYVLFKTVQEIRTIK